MDQDESRGFLSLAGRRQSVRKFLPDPVPEAVLDRCFEAARLAPSANNGQPWLFLASGSAEVRDGLARAARFGPARSNAFAAGAPVIVAVLETTGNRAARWGGALLGRSFPLMDLGMAVENFCLQAADEGLGACVIGLFGVRGVRRALGLPPSARPALLIAVGKPADGTIRAKKRRALGEIRRYVGKGA